MKRLIVLLVLAGCTGGGESPDIAISNTNNANATNNNNSQNGDSQCTFNCEPVQFDGAVGYLVSQECDGQLTDGPDFSPVCPEATVASAPEESGEVVAVEESPGLNQEGVI